MKKVLTGLTILIIVIISIEIGYYWASRGSSRFQSTNNILNQLRSFNPRQSTPPLRTVPTETLEEEQIKTLLDQVKSSANNYNIQEALENLKKGAEIILSQLTKAYPDRSMETTVVIPMIPDNPVLTQSLSEYLQNLDAADLTEMNPGRLAKSFYRLGLIAYRNNELSLLVPLWQNAIHLAPEWSYFYIELANFYASTGDFTEAKNVLNECAQFYYPALHCNIFMETTLGDNKIENIGFLEETIIKEVY